MAISSRRRISQVPPRPQAIEHMRCNMLPEERDQTVNRSTVVSAPAIRSHSCRATGPSSGGHSTTGMAFGSSFVSSRLSELPDVFFWLLGSSRCFATVISDHSESFCSGTPLRGSRTASSDAARRSAATASNSLPLLRRAAFLPVNASHRRTATSMNAGSNSIAKQTLLIVSAAIRVVPLPRNGS
jgi:hypothetical protein